MSRLLPILALVALAMAALAASILTGEILMAFAVYGIAVAVFLFLTRSMVPIVVGAVGVLLLALSLMGLLGGVATDGAGMDFGMGLELAGAFLVAGLAAVAGGVLAVRWDDMDPDWLGWVGAGALALAAIFAFIGMNQLGHPGSALGTATAVLLLVAIWPVVVALKAD